MHNKPKQFPPHLSCFQKRTTTKKQIDATFSCAVQRVVESVGQASLHLLDWMVLPLGASSVFHHGALCSGVSHQLMRSRMQQDAIAWLRMRQEFSPQCSHAGEAQTYPLGVTDAAVRRCN